MINRDPATLFSALYDCNHQAAFTAKGKDGQALQYFLGRLRLDAIINKKIVLTDGLIYDGSFFLTMANRGSLDQLPLGRIEIRSRAKSLDDAILRVFCDGDQLHLREIFLDSISEEQADHLHNALKSYPSSGVDHWRKLPKIFADLGLPREQAEQIENGWAKWIEAAHDGRVAFAQWDLQFDWKGHFHKELEEHKQLVGQRLATDFGKSSFQEVWDARAMRSRVASILLDGKRVQQGIEEAADLATIEVWFETAFNRTCAIHQGCGATYFMESDGARPFRRDQDLFDNFSQELSSGTVRMLPSELIAKIPLPFIASLGKLSEDTIAALLRDNQDSLSAWYFSGDISILQQPVANIIEVVDRIAPFTDHNPILARFLPPVQLCVRESAAQMREHGAYIGGALGGVVGAFIGHPAEGAALGAAIGKPGGDLAGKAIEATAKPVFNRMEKHSRVARCILELASDLKE